MVSVLIKLLEREGMLASVMFIVMALVFFIVYNIFFKKYIEDFKQTIQNFTTTMDANNEATKIVIFSELQREYYEKKEKGGKSINADERFQKMWKQYEKLGNGFGHSLKDEWDSLPII